MQKECGFRPSEVTQNPEFLFGRNDPGQLLDRLLINLRSGTNCQVLGERRSGKTSLLQCAQNEILSQECFEFKLPIYMNFKEYAFIKGNNNVFRFVIARCVSLLQKKINFSNPIHLRGIDISANGQWEDIYEQLIQVADFRIQGILEELIFWTANKHRIGYIFLIDEYEYLFKSSFDEPAGFFLFRNISATPLENEIKCLTFVITGKTRWDKICSLVGSPELNNLGTGILFVTPLDFPDFSEMWSYLLSKTTFKIPDILYDTRLIFDYSGGIPFYAKVIGESLICNDKELDKNILNPYFEELILNLEKAEIAYLKKLIENSRIETFSGSHELVKRGILKFQNSHLKINGVLFTQFIVNKLKEDELTTTNLDQRQIDLTQKVRKIKEFITELNDNSMNQNGQELFLVSNQDHSLYQDLEEICLDREDLYRFSSAMYNNLFERTSCLVEKNSQKKTKNLERLPKTFRFNRTFVKLVGSLRHHYGGHLTRLPTFDIQGNQFSKGELLNYILDKPFEPREEQIYKIQEKMIILFIEYLNELNEYLRK